MMETRRLEVGAGALSAKPIRLDTSRYPLVVVTFAAQATNEEYALYLTQLDAILARGTPNVIIFDTSRTATLPAFQRKLTTAWMRAHREALARLSLGHAFVITSATARGVLTAIFWIQPLREPHTVVATLAEAETWAIEKLRARGLAVPTKPG